MTYNLSSQHSKSQTMRTPKPSSPTAATIDNTPDHLTEHNHPYLANTHYQRSAASSATRKAISHLNTQEKNVTNQGKSSKTDLTTALIGMPSNISLNTREQITIINLIWNLFMMQ